MSVIAIRFNSKITIHGNRPSWWLEAGVSAATMIRSFIATYGPSAGQDRGENKTQDFDPNRQIYLG